MKQIFLFFLTLVSSFASSQETLKYHPKATLLFGRGFNLLNFSDTKKDFLLDNFTITRQERIESSITLKAITTEEKLDELLDYSVEMDATYLGFSASGNLNVSKSYIYNKKQLLLAFIAKISFGKEFLRNEELTTEAKGLIMNPEEFHNRFGNFYVAGQKREQLVVILCKISEVDENIKKTLSAQLDAGISLGALDFNTTATINQTFEKAFNEKKIDFESYKLGKFDFEKDVEILDYLNTENKEKGFNEGIKTIKSILTTHLKSFDIKNASVTEFYIGSFKNFGVPENIILSDTKIRYQKLQEVSRLYKRIQTSLNTISEILKLPYYSTYANPCDGYFLEATTQELNRMITRIRIKHQECMEKSCETNTAGCCEPPKFENTNSPLLFDYISYNKYLYDLEEELRTAYSKYSFLPYASLNYNHDVSVDLPPGYEFNVLGTEQLQTFNWIDPNRFGLNKRSRNNIRFKITMTLEWPIIDVNNPNRYIPQFEFSIFRNGESILQESPNGFSCMESVPMPIKSYVFPADYIGGRLFQPYNNTHPVGVHRELSFTTEQFPESAYGNIKNIQLKYLTLSDVPYIIRNFPVRIIKMNIEPELITK